MPRNFSDWIPAYLEYTRGTEAPTQMHFWTAVSCITSCLRRKIWIDMARFRWVPSFYIVFVAPPGIVSKTTTMDMGMDLVKQVPGVKFGPDVITWQALVTAFAAAQEDFQYGEDWVPMSPLTLASGEFGNLMNPQDRDMVNLFITLWDGRSSFEKVTKGSGSDIVSAPWINMIACTTPHWIADNMPAATVGGGFTSRCIFVYADRKENFIAFPDEHVRPDHAEFAARLTADLEHISVNLVGPYTITEEARVWGRAWYQRLWSAEVSAKSDEQLNGYLARKQTHMVKLAIVLAVSRGDEPVVTLGDFVLADKMLEATEPNLDKVFSRIGRTQESLHAERFVNFVRRSGAVPYQTAYRFVYTEFPDLHDFEGMLEGTIRSGQIKMQYKGNSTRPEDTLFVYVGA
jgi:hypothetical protein